MGRAELAARLGLGAMKYAVWRRILRTNLLPKGKESTAVVKTANAVDKRSLLNPEQGAAILDWIRRRPRGGERLHAFFAATNGAPGLRHVGQHPP
ncbi:predicted protein [Streptomyces viridochromogenes DSM 40736]|uniref:Predicted protein n=2 Tax=Streptomyces viridochromogenes TaxID=1938 RepID=D9XAR1_STRVT|nr:predicted protein [Streptomyces viridochromogenes DSM 40736]